MLIEQRVEEIKERCGKITTGKWRICQEEDDPMALTIYSDDIYICQLDYDGLSHTRRHNVIADAKFIAQAKSDIEWLLALLESRKV